MEICNFLSYVADLPLGFASHYFSESSETSVISRDRDVIQVISTRLHRGLQLGEVGLNGRNSRKLGVRNTYSHTRYLKRTAKDLGIFQICIHETYLSSSSDTEILCYL